MGKSRVIIGIILRRLTVVVNISTKFFTMRKPNGVSSAQRHHFFNRESPLCKDIYDLRHRHLRRREISVDERSFRDLPVSSAQIHSVVGPTDHGNKIPGRDGEDVGARDSVGALELQCGFGADDDVKGVAGEGVVYIGVAFGSVERGGGDKDGAVAAVEEAVVEEETEGAGGGGGAGDLLVGDYVLHDLLESRT